jgi:PleD family two-component response regulator
MRVEVAADRTNVRVSVRSVGATVTVGASIRVHLIGVVDRLTIGDLDHAVDGADQAMYRAKRAGKDQVAG